MARLLSTLLLALAMSGCDQPPNTQVLPIGSGCSSASECGSQPYDCVAALPGGYCTKPCATDGDCPSDSVCAARSCRRACKDTSECRASEGYVCRNESATRPVCDVPATP
jgi:hypothetical protein